MAAGEILLTMLLVVLTIMTATINNKTTIANMLMRMRKTIYNEDDVEDSAKYDADNCNVRILP